MKLFLIIALCAGAASAQMNFCLTLCNCLGSFVQCSNLPEFPLFYYSYIIETLMIFGGTLDKVPITKEEYPRLSVLILQNTPSISCDVLIELETRIPEVEITFWMDCSRVTTASTTTSDTTRTTTSSFTTEITDIVYTSTTTDTTTISNSTAVTQNTALTIQPTAATPNHGNNHDDSDERYTALVASITSVGVVVIIIIVVIVSWYCYKKYRNQVVPFGSRMNLDASALYMHNPVYQSTTV